MLVYFVLVLLAIFAVLEVPVDASKANNLRVALAAFLGIIATLTGVIQYIPQVWFTWANKHGGALSPAMLLMQCPGSFVFVASLMVQPGTNWTSWISFLVSGSLQGVLLVMMGLFYLQSGGIRANDAEAVVDDAFPNETEPLMQSDEHFDENLNDSAVNK